VVNLATTNRSREKVHARENPEYAYAAFKLQFVASATFSSCYCYYIHLFHQTVIAKKYRLHTYYTLTHTNIQIRRTNTDNIRIFDDRSSVW